MMTRLANQSVRRRLVALATFGMVAGITGGAIGVGTAAAAPVEYAYTVTGSSHLAKPKSDVKLGPGNMKADLDVQTGKFTGEFTMPKTTSSFKAFGLIDTSADVEIVAVKPVAGSLVDGKAKATLTADFKLSNVKIAGVGADVGAECKGAQPTVIELASEPGFDPLKGGELSGTFTLGNFSDKCGALAPLINMLVPGPDNTVNIKLAKAA